MDAHKNVDFLDVLAWLHCPMAAKAGYRPAHPLKDPVLAAEILEGFPRSIASLGQITPKSKQAADWLGRTRFGANKIIQPYGSPPPHAVEKHGYWNGRTGYIYLGEITLRFTLPYLHQLSEVWEIVVMDTHPLPPTLNRYADLTLYMGFLKECFQHLTGKRAVMRLVAPGYEQEESPELPDQQLISAVRMMHVLEFVSFLRVGPHCNQHENHKWLCPLREAKQCMPFGKPKRLAK